MKAMKLNHGRTYRACEYKLLFLIKKKLQNKSNSTVENKQTFSILHLFL